MVEAATDSHSVERRALLALWAIPGLGPRMLDALRTFAGGRLDALAATPVRDWVGQAPLTSQVRRRLAGVPELASLASRLEAECEAGEMRVAFAGEPEYP